MLKKIPVLAALLLVLAPAPQEALAYDKVCLRLHVGSGYVARLWARFANGGETGRAHVPLNTVKCHDISHIPAGQKVEVFDSAIAGNTARCGYFIQNPLPIPISYYARGTSLSHSCRNRPY